MLKFVVRSLQIVFVLSTRTVRSREQYISRNSSAFDLREDLFTENSARNNKLLFVCVVNLQGNSAQQSQFKRMIEQGILSIARFYPGSEVLIQFGSVGATPNLNLPASMKVKVEEIETDSFNAEGKYTSYGRMKTYADIINLELQKSRPRGIIFYDADMLFVGNHFSKVFFSSRIDWAVGLSFRNMPKFPVNCGLMLVSQNNLEKGLNFWKRILISYEEGSKFHGKTIRKNDTVADQFATCKVIESFGKYYVKPREHVRKLESMNDTKILLLPTRRWNWTPKPMCNIDSRCAILHFKGHKKVHMTKASKLMLSVQDSERSLFFRSVAKLGSDPKSSRRVLKKGCSD